MRLLAAAAIIAISGSATRADDCSASARGEAVGCARSAANAPVGRSAWTEAKIDRPSATVASAQDVDARAIEGGETLPPAPTMTGALLAAALAGLAFAGLGERRTG